MRLKSEKGQAIVEFALVLPILIILICGIIDFGWVFSCKIAAANAAREAARYTAIHIYDSSTDNDENIAKGIVFSDASQLPQASTIVTLSSLDLNKDGIQESIQITITSPVNLLTGMTSIILGKSTITISSSSIMKIEN